ncbi:hypothetical protein A3K71_05455 [archaeon RBG_16_50_20]|nr:MAG: hypothetical protein A3K71_05455 [archaeon RBG_16_50_20]
MTESDSATINWWARGIRTLEVEGSNYETQWRHWFQRLKPFDFSELLIQGGFVGSREIWSEFR